LAVMPSVFGLNPMLKKCDAPAQRVFRRPVFHHGVRNRHRPARWPHVRVLSLGVPTIVPREGECHSLRFKMYTSGGEDLGGFRVQYHRFEEGSPLHSLLRTMSDVAGACSLWSSCAAARAAQGLGPWEKFPLPLRTAAGARGSIGRRPCFATRIAAGSCALWRGSSIAGISHHIMGRVR
jgi:hypothetical protein